MVTPYGAVNQVDLSNPGWGNMQTSYEKSPLKEISAKLVGFKNGMSSGNNPRVQITLQFTDMTIAPGGSDVFVADTTAEISVPHSEYMNSGWGALGKSIEKATGQPLETLKISDLVGQRLHMYRDDNYLFFIDNKTGQENRGTAWKVIKVLGEGEELVHYVEPDEQLPEFLAKQQASVGTAPVAAPPPVAAPVAAPPVPAEESPKPTVSGVLSDVELMALDAMHGLTQADWWNLIISNTAIREADGGADLLPQIISGAFSERMLADGFVSVAGKGETATYAVVGK